MQCTCFDEPKRLSLKARREKRISCRLRIEWERSQGNAPSIGASREAEEGRSEADLRRLLAGFVIKARDISPDVPPWPGPPGSGDI
jgi:hypothetical protein